jgi:uncharacterized protein (DUF924 family)
MEQRANEILSYWFGEEPVETTAAFKARARFWFAPDLAVDEHIRSTFMADVERAERGELALWTASARSRLALLILLDQFPRNAFRGTARAFVNDPAALKIATEGIDGGHAESLALAERFVFGLPLMHAEDRAVQTRSCAYYEHLLAIAPPELAPELREGHSFALRHRAIVERFGRYPHRNTALGRSSTPEEIAFLKEPGSSF